MSLMDRLEQVTLEILVYQIGKDTVILDDEGTISKFQGVILALLVIVLSIQNVYDAVALTLLFVDVILIPLKSKPKLVSMSTFGQSEDAKEQNYMHH